MPSSQWNAEGAPAAAKRPPRLLATDWLQSPPVVRSSVLAVRGFPLAASLHCKQSFLTGVCNVAHVKAIGAVAVQSSKYESMCSVTQVKIKMTTIQ